MWRLVQTPNPLTQGANVLLLIVLVIEALLDDNAGEGLLAYLNRQLSTQLGMGSIYKSHADTLITRNGMIARGDFTDLLAIEQHVVAMTRNSLVLQFDTDDALLGTVGFLLLQGFLADELILLELAEH